MAGNPWVSTDFYKLDDRPKFSEDFFKKIMQIGKKLTELEVCKVG